MEKSMSYEYDSSAVKEGFKFGIGALIGWFLMRWSILFILTLVFSVCLCTVCTRHEKGIDAKLDKVVTTTETTFGVNLLENNKTVKFKSDCNMRLHPTTKSSIVGTVEKNTTYQPLEIKDSWILVSVNGKQGWVGCRKQ